MYLKKFSSFVFSIIMWLFIFYISAQFTIYLMNLMPLSSALTVALSTSTHPEVISHSGFIRNIFHPLRDLRRNPMLVIFFAVLHRMSPNHGLNRGIRFVVNQLRGRFGLGPIDAATADSMRLPVYTDAMENETRRWLESRNQRPYITVQTLNFLGCIIFIFLFTINVLLISFIMLTSIDFIIAAYTKAFNSFSLMSQDQLPEISSRSQRISLKAKKNNDYIDY